MANLIEGLQEELNRNRELLKEYEAIGPNGAFGAHFIREGIKAGEAAIASGDTVKMVECLGNLKENK